MKYAFRKVAPLEHHMKNRLEEYSKICNAGGLSRLGRILETGALKLQK